MCVCTCGAVLSRVTGKVSLRSAIFVKGLKEVRKGGARSIGDGHSEQKGMARAKALGHSMAGRLEE